MAKKKNYLSNNELKEEILNCITAGYNKAVKNGFDSTLPVYDDVTYSIVMTMKLLKNII